MPSDVGNLFPLTKSVLRRLGIMFFSIRERGSRVVILLSSVACDCPMPKRGEDPPLGKHYQRNREDEVWQ